MYNKPATILKRRGFQRRHKKDGWNYVSWMRGKYTIFKEGVQGKDLGWAFDYNDEPFRSYQIGRFETFEECFEHYMQFRTELEVDILLGKKAW